MSTEDDLDQIRLLSRRQVADAIGRSPDTLDDWCERGQFPRPIQTVPGGPKQWTLATVKAWISKRQRARYSPPAPRGALWRGGKLNKKGKRIGGRLEERRRR